MKKTKLKLTATTIQPLTSTDLGTVHGGQWTDGVAGMLTFSCRCQEPEGGNSGSIRGSR